MHSNEYNAGVGNLATPNTAGEIIADGGTIRSVQTEYTTAVTVQRPRDLLAVQKRCKLQEAEIGGELFYYRWTAKSKGGPAVIEGPSIKCAMAAIRNFGNCAIVQKPVQETRGAFIFTTGVVDLETGFTFERSFKLDKKFPVGGDRMDQFRADDIRFQIGQSKSIRNVVVNFVPAGIIDRMVQVAQTSVRNQLEDRIKKAGGNIAVVIDAMVKKFEQFGVTADMIVAKHGAPRKAWDVGFLTGLAAELRAFEIGDESPATLYREQFGEEETTPAADDKPGLTEADISEGDPATRKDYENGRPPKTETPTEEPEADETKPTEEQSLAEQKIALLKKQIAVANLNKDAKAVKKLTDQLARAEQEAGL